MPNNLFIAYDLYQPGQNYTAVAVAIKQLGFWAHVQKSLWYVRTAFTSEQACQHVWQSMDRNDSLIVIDSTNDKAAWRNLSNEVANFLAANWRTQAA